eukprot:750788-Hanusia_phi.AAC.3
MPSLFSSPKGLLYLTHPPPASPPPPPSTPSYTQDNCGVDNLIDDPTPDSIRYNLVPVPDIHFVPELVLDTSKLRPLTPGVQSRSNLGFAGNWFQGGVVQGSDKRFVGVGVVLMEGKGWCTSLARGENNDRVYEGRG